MQVVRAQALVRILFGIIIKMSLAKKPKPAKAKSKRGRKPIFTPAQLNVLNRMIREALRDQLRRVVRGL